MTIVRVPSAIIAETLEALREAGNCERVVLWFGVRDERGVRVDTVQTPVQEAARDYFSVPRDSILEICRRVAESGGMVAAQVHTHPGAAFHSAADDRWAIVRHEGALSLVVPRFAQHTEVASFLQDCAVYRLSAQNAWIRVQAHLLETVLVIE